MCCIKTKLVQASCPAVFEHLDNFHSASGSILFRIIVNVTNVSETSEQTTIKMHGYYTTD